MTPQNDTHQRLHINRKEILNLNPMDKIKLRLCAGTMCYVMGGAQLMEIEELLSEEEKQGIKILKNLFSIVCFFFSECFILH